MATDQQWFLSYPLLRNDNLASNCPKRKHVMSLNHTWQQRVTRGESSEGHALERLLCSAVSFSTEGEDGHEGQKTKDRLRLDLTQMLPQGLIWERWRKGRGFG